jgi:hypothetical protein
VKTRSLRLGIVVSAVGVFLLLAVILRSGPRCPVALIRVVDAAGKPVSGALIAPDGLRTKPGPYESGHYGWRTAGNWPTNTPVRTDSEGCARIPYPKYVFERIETGQISFSVTHPDFVPDRPFRVVTISPPIGAPPGVWLDYVWYRIRQKALIARPDPVVLQRGATLRISLRSGSPLSQGTNWSAQISGVVTEDGQFWTRPEPGVLLTHQLAAGARNLRAVSFHPDGQTWFSDLIDITAVANQTNDVQVNLRPSITLHGRLDTIVPRPITGGRVIAHVWSSHQNPQSSPPQWHAWTPVRADGSFELASLPEGELEIVALCNGFVSTNGPGQFRGMHYPQKYSLGTNDPSIVIGMEPTASLAARVVDDHGNPVKGATVSTWPNVRYGEWSAVILGTDTYNTADLMQNRAPVEPFWLKPSPFQATSDGSGLAVIQNLPVEVTSFSVDHPQLALPAVSTGSGQKRRESSVALAAGATNQAVVRLEPQNRSPIAHY